MDAISDNWSSTDPYQWPSTHKKCWHIAEKMSFYYDTFKCISVKEMFLLWIYITADYPIENKSTLLLFLAWQANR